MNTSASSIRVVPAVGHAVTGVGKYRYIAMLAEGGMADVYLAVTQSAGFEKLVVIKQLRDSLAEDPSFVAMFMDEARLAARLNHPNVVQTLEVGTDRTTGLHFIAMEFLEGVAHVRFARRKERVPPPLAFHIRVIIDVLRGLHYAHDLRDFDGTPLNVVHRDVSPQNVMLTFDGVVKVLDFGIAKAALAKEQRPEDFKGKLEYMAPEQARMEDVDRRADVFSVGVMLFEALTRRRLFRKGDDKLDLLVNGGLPHILDVAPQTPKKLAEICVRAMAFERDDRFATADAMADELEEWLLGSPQHVSGRDVGAYIAEKFASTRTKISAAIEAQLAVFRATREDSPENIPLSRIPMTEMPPADVSEPPPPLAPGGLPPMFPSTPSLPHGWSTDGAVVTGVHGAITVPPQPRPAPPGTSWMLVATIALSGLAVTAGLVFFAITLRAKQASPTMIAASTSPSARASAAPAPAEEAQIDLTIKSMPDGAAVSIDGKPFGSAPVSGRRPRDGAIHSVRVEAPGHEPREESIAFDRSLFISLDLHPVPPTTDPPAPASKPGRRPGRR